MLYQLFCALTALLLLLGAVFAVGALLWLLCRPKKTEITCAVVRFAAGEKNAAARTGFLLTATALLFGAAGTAVIAVLAPGTDEIRRELSAAFPGARRLTVCSEEELPAALKKRTSREKSEK